MLWVFRGRYTGEEGIAFVVFSKEGQPGQKVLFS